MFELRLLITNGHGIPGNPDMVTVIITANDDAYGIFSLVTVSFDTFLFPKIHFWFFVNKLNNKAFCIGACI